MGMLNNIKISPLKGKTSIGYSSDFGERILNGEKNFHSGIDFPGQNGAKEIIVAVAPGKVVAMRNNIKGFSTTYSSGNYVTIDHGNGIKTVYCHMEYNTIKVKVGDYVVANQELGLKGKTGHSFGAHLHFGVNVNGTYVDPKPYLLGEKSIEANATSDAFTTFIRDLQEAVGANVDGVSGPETLSKTITISTSTNWNHPTVKILQTYLVSLGYDLGKYGVDGKFGTDMKNVIKKYQQDNNLSCVDGVITAKMYTWKKLLLN